MKRDIFEEAKGRWPSILPQLGIPAKLLDRKQHPCPACGGKDRFRFDDGMQKGGSFCNVCGAMNGIQLLQKVNGWDFATSCQEVRNVLPTSTETKPMSRDDEALRLIMRRMWKESEEITPFDDAGRYLASRGLTGPYPKALRFSKSTLLNDGDERKYFPALLAMVYSPDGVPVSIHRTYLLDGRKAPIAQPRRMMPGLCNGEVPAGSYIPLAEAADEMGVGEGIETTWAVMRDRKLPCWSLINATNLESFTPPEMVKRLWILGDNDLKFAGQAAAYRLAHRVSIRPGAPEVIVDIPSRPGTDWADTDATMEKAA